MMGPCGLQAPYMKISAVLFRGFTYWQNNILHFKEWDKEMVRGFWKCSATVLFSLHSVLSRNGASQNCSCVPSCPYFILVFVLHRSCRSNNTPKPPQILIRHFSATITDIIAVASATKTCIMYVFLTGNTTPVITSSTLKIVCRTLSGLEVILNAISSMSMMRRAVEEAPMFLHFEDLLKLVLLNLSLFLVIVYLCCSFGAKWIIFRTGKACGNHVWIYPIPDLCESLKAAGLTFPTGTRYYSVIFIPMTKQSCSERPTWHRKKKMIHRLEMLCCFRVSSSVSMIRLGVL